MTQDDWDLRRAWIARAWRLEVAASLERDPWQHARSAAHAWEHTRSYSDRWIYLDRWAEQAERTMIGLGPSL